MTPILPHFANECIKLLKDKSTITWPNIDKKLLIEQSINFVIQINGKTRGIMKLKTGFNEKQILEKIKEDEKISNYINDKLIKNTIFIPDKLINIIVKS